MSAFSYITQLQYRIKGLEKELEAFNSGAIYDKFKAIRDADFRAFHRKIDKLNNALAEVKRLLEEEHGKNLKLKAQMNRDYENSSIPSSRSVNHKMIKNFSSNESKKKKTDI